MTEISDEIKVRFATGECSDEELQTVARWMKESDANAAELLALERAYREAQACAMPHREVEKALERTHALIEEREEQEGREEHDGCEKREGCEAAAAGSEDTGSDDTARTVKMGVLRRWIAAAAVVLVLVCAGLYTMREYKASQPEMKYLMAKASATTPRQVLLADGTRVWLNCGATLSYPEQFSDTLRKVALTGEGYFEVAKDSRKPFVVEGTTLDVRVLGTVFNFRNGGSGSASEVSLLEGSVRVSAERDNSCVVLRPGQKASLAEGNGIVVSNADTRLDAVWHTRVIPFEESNIRQIADVLEQLYDVKIVVGKGVDMSKTYSGEIQWNESIEKELSLLQNTLPISYEKKGKVIHIN